MEARHEIERLAKTYADLILRLSYARLGSAYDAQDVCQTVFLKLLAKLEDDGARFLDAEHCQATPLSVSPLGISMSLAETNAWCTRIGASVGKYGYRASASARQRRGEDGLPEETTW